MLVSPEVIFSLASKLIMPMWLLLIIVPNWKVTQWLIQYKVVPLILSVVYTVYLFLAVQGGSGLDFGSLASVMQLFTVKNAVLAGWVHYLAFDLLIGMRMVRQNRALKFHRLIMAPILVATLMAGPIGFLLFTLLKTTKSVKA